MQWYEDLRDDQREIASYVGTHARLLAGPGTGKTLVLTRRIAYLVNEENVPPEKILVLTFTRAAAFELRKRIAEMLGDRQANLVRVSTLHSFALRQLLRNSRLIESIPRPIRIADDWEERNIIVEDLKSTLRYNAKTVKERFNLLSADWETLNADNEEWEAQFPDAEFLSAWRQHRAIYGYTLRSELVYRLKKALEQIGEFSLESDYSHLLVDEYQDLNHCDQALILALRDRGIEVFAAGDDDQSIYGFRHAYPEGIRKFTEEFIPSKSFTLDTCLRCDRRIVDLASFVAKQDPYRTPKTLNAAEDAEEGEVYILRFRDQYEESEKVAKICDYLINQMGYKPDDILILMRSDRNRVFSSVIKDALESQNISAAIRSEGTPLDTDEGRVLLAFLRLLVNENDNLALRTLLMKHTRGIGGETFSKLNELAISNGETFSETVREVMEQPELISHTGGQISNEMQIIQDILNEYRDSFAPLHDSSDSQDLLNAINVLANDNRVINGDSSEILQYLEHIITETNSTNLEDLLRALSSSIENAEQELVPGKVNIMTMHRAKGLTAEAVIIIAAEDEYIPGNQEGEQVEEDERRLLYVSLSRAKHFLVITYCDERKDAQIYTGRTAGRRRRTLTRFLRDIPYSLGFGPFTWEKFTDKLGGRN